jgi:hypothetical protein
MEPIQSQIYTKLSKRTVLEIWELLNDQKVTLGKAIKLAKKARKRKNKPHPPKR